MVSPRLRRLILGDGARTADLITGLVGLAKKGGGWSVTFISAGLTPADIRALTLTDATDRASEAVAALYAKHAPVDGAELAFAIFPWGYDGGPIFDVEGQRGSYVARDIQGSDVMVSGGTLEDLVTTIERIPDVVPDDAMLRWIRPVASLPMPLTSPVSE